MICSKLFVYVLAVLYHDLYTHRMIIILDKYIKKLLLRNNIFAPKTTFLLVSYPNIRQIYNINNYLFFN